MSTFIERYFGKKANQITYDDFNNFIKQKVEEHQTLEYKPRGLIVGADDKIRKTDRPQDGFNGLAKSVASMANAEGGLLILGVKEKPEKHKGKIVKIRPGTITPIPPTVTRESIEMNLVAKIQYPIEGLTIVPLQKSERSKYSVYLIDIPQSKKPPHRVNEQSYYQRYNFITQEMKHYQIADIFGRRTGPDLAITIEEDPTYKKENRFRIKVTLLNCGGRVAKYTACVCDIIKGGYRISNIRQGWKPTKNSMSAQFSTGSNAVIYPKVPNETGSIEFVTEGAPKNEKIQLSFSIYAENMPNKRQIIEFDPKLTSPTRGR